MKNLPGKINIPKRSCPTSFVNCEVLADQFYDWFSSVEGGNFVPEFLEEHKKKSKMNQNKKVSQMVKSMLVLQFGNEDFHISQLGELINIGRHSESVIAKLAEGRTWSTVRNYLHCYSHFLDFLEATIPTSILDRDIMNSLRVSLKGCIRTVTKMAQEELQKRKIRDRSRLLNWTHVCNCIDAQLAYVNMYKFKHQQSHDEQKHLAMKVGTHLLLHIALQNGKRTGIYADMTVQQFRDAEKEMDGYVVLIDEGKTFRVTGGAGIFLSKSEYALLAEYIDKCRILFKPKTDQVFCRPSGERSEVHDLHKLIKKGWEEFGERENEDVGEISCSLIRKTLVSVSRKEGIDRSTQQDMARHMDHSVDTADRHYDVNTGVKVTAKFRQIIQRFKESELGESDSEASDQEDSNCCIQISASLQGTLEEASNVCTERSSVGSKCISSQNGTQSFRFGRECIFSDEDAVRLKRCCASVIEKGRRKECTVTKAMIMAAVKSAGPAFIDLMTNYTESQICTKVRTEIRKKNV